MAPQAGVTKSVEAGACVSGYPARPHDQAMHIQANLSRLPELIRRVKELEEELLVVDSAEQAPKE